jgi:hypothetical protein
MAGANTNQEQQQAYDEALLRIEACLRENNTSLDLSDRPQ